MKNKQLYYWLLTGFMSFYMLFAAWFAETHQADFTGRMGFPAYFRIELTTAKILGAIVLLFPQTPQRIREWVYVGFCICMISAFIAKCNSGYGFMQVAQPAFSLVFFVLAIFLLHRVNQLPGSIAKERV
ncbi:MAG: DoxX family protein [Mucilaginibacter sp.]|nr:DoxX family protein [Mucilaginibacter sp.]